MISPPHFRASARVLVTLTFIYLFGFGSRGLNEPDEGRYVNIALEMLEPGQDKWDPQLSDVGHYDKPPLIYWATALSLQLGGHRESAARFPSLLGAVMTLIGIFWAGYRLYGQRTAWLALWMSGTLLHIWALSRLLSPDMLLCGCCTLAIAAWAETRHRQKACPFYVLQVFFWVLAWWTKATPALVPFAGLTLYTLISKNPIDRKALRPATTFALILLLGSPWYIYIIWKHPELTDFFFKRELAGRITGHEDGRRGILGFHLFVALLVWLPWWPYVVFQRFRERGRRSLQGLFILKNLKMEGFMVCFGLLVFSCISSKLPTYILTLSPWATLLMARQLPQGKFPWFPGLAAIVLYLSFSSIAPRYETSLDKNSSMKLLCKTLENENAQTLISLRHFSGLEFYWPEEDILYLVDAPIQNTEDLGKVAGHFFKNPELIENLPDKSWVLVLERDLKKLQNWDTVLQRDQEIHQGNFLLIPLSI